MCIGDRDKLPKEADTEVAVQYGERDYKAVMRVISMDKLLEESGLVEMAQENDLIALYLFDETELNQYIRQKEDEKLVTGLLYLDNYEEALNSVEEVRRSLLVALIESCLLYTSRTGDVNSLFLSLIHQIDTEQNF